MTNNIQCSIESSTTKIELNSAVEGVFLVPELEGLAGLPEIRTTSGVNAGYDGGWTSAQNYDARLISIRGVIANPDVSQVEAKRRAIASLLGQGRKEQLTLRLTTEAGNSYAISVRTISCEMALQRVLTTQEFLIQLRADDPLIYDDGASAGTEAILHVQRALGGFEINFELPLAIGGGAESTIVENGEEMVYPIIKLYGPLHSPTVVNTTTNQQMQLNADLQYTVNWSGYENEEGSAIAISDGVENAPMSLTQLNGNATQTTYSGKNLSSVERQTNLTWGNTSASLLDILNALPAGSYMFSCKFKLTARNDATDESKYGWYFVIPTKTIINRPAWGNVGVGTTVEYTLPFTIETNEVGTFTRVYAYGCGVTTATGSADAIEIQIEAGSTATAYEPYVGGTASPNPDYPQAIEVVTGEQTIDIVPEQKNIANPQTFIDWVNKTYNLCVQYNWTPDASRPTYGSFSGRNSVASYTGSTLYSVRNNMTSPTYAEACRIYEGIFEEGKQYTISADLYSEASNGTPNLCFNYTDGTYSFIQGTGTANQWVHITQTSNANKTVASIGITYASAAKAHIDLDTLQIEEGSTATTYEPYQGRSYEVNLGKNLFDVNRTLGTPSDTASANTTKRTYDYSKYVLGLSANNYYYSTMVSSCSVANGAVTVTVGTTAYGVGFPVDVKPSTTYTLSCDKTTTATGDVRIIYYQSDGTWLSFEGQNNTPVPLTFTTPSNCEFIVVLFRPDAGIETTYSNIQLELGSQATSYAPYFTPIELAKIGTYRDRIYKDDGKWYIEKQIGKVVLDGTEAWTATGGGNGYRIAQSDIVLTPANTLAPIMSDYFTTATFSSIYNATVDYGIANHNSNYWIVLRDKNWTSASDVTTWLASNPTTVYYALATPTDTEITDDTLLAQLNTISELYGGQNNISIVPSAGAQGTMIVSYATEYTVDQDVAVIDSQARTITINGQDAYHLKTDESEFLLLAPGENKLYLTSATDTDEGYAEVKFKQGYLSI